MYLSTLGVFSQLHRSIHYMRSLSCFGDTWSLIHLVPPPLIYGDAFAWFLSNMFIF
jgi:hypothetical protein